MRLEHTGSTIDIDARIAHELAALPGEIELEGNEMCVAIARALLADVARVRESAQGVRIVATSLEENASLLLACMLEGTHVPERNTLFATIPEAALLRLAEKFKIRPVEMQRTQVRELLDRIAAEQPQTYLSLARSFERLAPHLRKMSE